MPLGHHIANILEKMASQEVCGQLKIWSHPKTRVGTARRAKKTERKGWENKKRVGEKDEPQNKGGLWSFV